MRVQGIITNTPPSGSEGCLARTERGKVRCLSVLMCGVFVHGVDCVLAGDCVVCVSIHRHKV